MTTHSWADLLWRCPHCQTQNNLPAKYVGPDSDWKYIGVPCTCGRIRLMARDTVASLPRAPDAMSPEGSLRKVLGGTIVSSLNVGAEDAAPSMWRVTRRGQSDGPDLWCLRGGMSPGEVVAVLTSDPRKFKRERERLNSEMDDDFIARTRAPLACALDFAELWPGASLERVQLIRGIAHLLENTERRR